MTVNLPSIWDSALHGDEAAVAAHISAGTDINVMNAAGCTPAHAAARGGQVHVIKLLASKGADLEPTNNDGRLPVHEAAKAGHVEALKVLHELGCALDVQTEHGQSVLDIAKGDAVRQYIRSALSAGKGQQGVGTFQKSQQPARSLKQPASATQRSALRKPAVASGSSLHSGKAKKEYLKWKRTQKQQHSGTDTEDDLSPAAPAVTAVSSAATDTPALQALSINNSAHNGPEKRRSMTQQTGGSGSVPTQPVPAAPRQRRREPAVSTSRDLPVQYARLEVLPDNMGCAVPGLGVQQAETVPADAAACTTQVQLPRCHAHEVGMSQEGVSLGMPKRPAWRGRVRTASDLHALEEAAFKAWQQAITSGFEPGRVSWYEDRLEYWRQLWRVLDLCHVALMIVDARNPLLHFSPALATHMLEEQHKPLVLVLNKADLVPAASIAAWVKWFTARFPGIAVVPSSAAAGAAEAAAHRILDAVMDCTISYQGQITKVSTVVDKSTDAVLQESQHRNAASKRRVAAAVDRNAAILEQPGDDESASAAALTTEGSDGEDDKWMLKGNKARKMGAKRKKRAHRMSQHVTTASGAPGTKPVRGQVMLQVHRAVGPARLPAGKGHLAAAHQGGSSAASDVSASDSEATGHDVSSGIEQEVGALTQPVEDEDEGEMGEEEEEEEPNCNADLDQWEHDDLQAPTQEGQGGEAATAASTTDRAGAQAGSSKRPVVVCVVGEPNVGKSSTMNALLGAHKVAVSSHPGRTKHYQTHYMTSQLMLCDCPGLVFPRLDVPLHMQVLYGSYPIARCRDPYAVIGYLAAHCWPRLHVALGLRKVDEQGTPVQSAPQPGQAPNPDESWTPLELCEAFAAKKSWRLRKGGRLDVYRAANWLLRAALAGKHGVSLAFLPPPAVHEPCSLQPQTCC